MLQPAGAAPLIRQDPQISSLVATLATGILAGPAGAEVRTTGSLADFFADVRRWYGHDETLLAEVDGETENGNPIAALPDFEAFDLGLSQKTHFQAFRVYAPWIPFEDRGAGIPADFQIAGVPLTDGEPFVPLDLGAYLESQGRISGLAALTGPFTGETGGYLPAAQPLPYAVSFQNDPSSTTLVREIRIVAQLDEDLDARSFRLGDIKVGDITIRVPEGRGVFQGDFDFTQTKGFIVRVSAGIDLAAEQATWLIQAIDPATGVLATDPTLGLLPPNDALGVGAGFVSYTVETEPDVETGAVVTASARVLFNNAPGEDTPTLEQVVDGVAPASTLTVTPLGGDTLQVDYAVTDDDGGSGFRHVTLYVAENDGAFRIWKRQLTEAAGTEVFSGTPGSTYTFLALATDVAGNREAPPVGASAEDDGSAPNLGALPSVPETTPPDFGVPPETLPDPSTNPLFTRAEEGVPAAETSSEPSEFENVLRPFNARRFAYGFVQSEAGIGPMAIAEMPDGRVLVIGGAARNELFVFDPEGGEAISPLATLPHPVFNLALGRPEDGGRLFATTGGGPLLEIDPADGAVLDEFGSGATTGLAVDPATGLLYVGTSQGVVIFDPASESFTPFSRDLDLRVGALAFASDGTLWATTWPDRTQVVRFTDSARAETMLLLDAGIDSIAFGPSGTPIEGLLFVSSNDGRLVLADPVTLRKVTLADGGSRGDVVITTSTGRVLLSQSAQVDVLAPSVAPSVIATSPADQEVAGLPLALLGVRFDQDMRDDGSNEGSVTHPASYTLVGALTGDATILDAAYEPGTRTVLLTVEGLTPDVYTLAIDAAVLSADGLAMGADHAVSFTAIRDTLAFVDLDFTNVRSDRSDETVSYDVTITNTGDFDLLIPLLLIVDPADGVTAVPQTDLGQDEQGRWLIDLSGSVSSGLSLAPGESTTGTTVTSLNTDLARIEAEYGVSADPAANQPPQFTTTPPAGAVAGQAFEYEAEAIDPDGGSVVYLLVRGPAGMTVDRDTGTVQWQPTSDDDASSEVLLHAYDARGGRDEQRFTLDVAGGNHAPAFDSLPAFIAATEGDPMAFSVFADDLDGDTLVYWADGLPGGALFDPDSRVFAWTPAFDQAGTYGPVTFHAFDGRAMSSVATTILASEVTPPLSLADPPNHTVTEGDRLRFTFAASGANLEFIGSNLPAGATIDRASGTLDWVAGFDQAGTYDDVIITVRSGAERVSKVFKITVLNANGAPQFEPLDDWRAFEGEEVRFSAFAFDPDNPRFVLPTRLPDGTVAPLAGTDPTVTYTVQDLPAGATFDDETATFSWVPGFEDAGRHTVTFVATDDGDGTGSVAVSAAAVSIEVINLNRDPVITPIANTVMNRDEVLDLPIAALDPDGDPVMLAITALPPGFDLPSFATFTDDGGGTGTLRLQPGTGDRGDYTFTITATDDGNGDGAHAIATAGSSFVLTVESVNEPPVLAHVGAKVAVVGDPFVLDLQASDLDGEPLHFEVTGLPAAANLTEGPEDGAAQISWTPLAGDEDTYDIIVTVSDGGNGSAGPVATATETISITVRPVNGDPVLDPIDTQDSVEDVELILALTADDPDGDALTFEVTGLPEGASFDRAAGVLTWTPTHRQAGSYDLLFTASDGHAEDMQPARIIVDDVNQAPTLIPLAPQFGREDALLEFRVTGGDQDGDALTYRIDGAIPTGSRLNGITGEFSWRPGFDQAGTHVVRFLVQDSGGATDVLEVLIRIDDSNRPPVLSTSDHAATIGAELRFTITADDPDPNTVLVFDALHLPEGATIGHNTGEIVWTPGPGQAGDHVVTLEASDGTDTARQTIVLNASTQPESPVVTVELTPGFAVVPGQRVTIRAIADSLADITAIAVTVDGSPLAIDATGRAEIIAEVPGRLGIVATATDLDGLTGNAAAEVTVRDPADALPPVVSLDQAIAAAPLDDPIPVIGAVSETDLDFWTLEIAQSGTDLFTLLAGGNALPNGATLTTLDPNDFPNGFHRLRLSAQDRAGRRATVERDIEINSDDKSSFTLTAIDLTLDLGAAQMAIRRTYDTFDRNHPRKFGYGWRFDGRDTDVATNARTTGREHLGIYAGLREGDRVYLNLPDGRRAGFTFAPRRIDLPALTYYEPEWIADVSGDFVLSSIDALLVKSGGVFHELDTGLAYHPASPFLDGDADYRLTAPDGTVYLVDSHRGVTGLVTPTGVEVFFSDSGITSHADGAIQLFTDSTGMVTAARSTTGDEVHNRYHDGNLVGVIATATGRTERYGYDQDDPHLLALASDGAGAAEQVIPGSVPATRTIHGDLGDVTNFAGRDWSSLMLPGDSNRFSLAVEPEEIAAVEALLLRVTVDAQASGLTAVAMTVDGDTPVTSIERGGRTVAVFAVSDPGLHVLEVAGQPGATGSNYQLRVDVAGDVNGDGAVDGVDSQAQNAAFEAVDGQAAYVFEADVDGNGVVDTQDRLALVANFGFVPMPFVAPSLPAAPGVAPPPTSAPAPASPPATASSEAQDGTQSLVAEGIPNATLQNGGFGISGDASWNQTGNVIIEGGAARLAEDALRQARMTQSFLLSDWADALRIVIADAVLTAALPGVEPDAFEIALFDANALTPVVGTVSAFGDTDALLNLQASGDLHTGPDVTVADDNGALIVTVDLSNVAPGSALTLFFDLLGFGAVDASIVIDGVTLLGGQAPTAVDDEVETNEDETLEIDVLDNDLDADGNLDPAGLEIVALPVHGAVSVDPVTGLITYAPESDFAGADGFTYIATDLGGEQSLEALVEINVLAVADVPSLVVAAARGPQDTEIPLPVDALPNDRDGSESLAIFISSVPDGGVLSAGTIVAPGRWALSPTDLSGLRFLPPAGEFGEFAFDVVVDAVEAGNGDTASTTAELTVDVDLVATDPLAVTAYEINGGDAQRSLIQTLKVTFNKAIWSADLSRAVRIVGNDGRTFTVGPEHVAYDPVALTLTIFADGLDLADDHFALLLSTDGIRNAASRQLPLTDADLLPGDGFHGFHFHRLLADFEGSDVVDRQDFDRFTGHYRTQPGDSGFDLVFDLDGNGVVDRFDYAIWRRRQSLTSDRYDPTLLAALQNDTGRDADDGITLDPTVFGGITDPSAIARFEATLDGGPTVEASAELDNGIFLFDLATFESVFGTVLEDGPHTVTLVAEDMHGNRSDPFVVSFELDRVAPPTPVQPDLNADSDSGALNDDDITNDQQPVFTASAEDGALVVLLLDDQAVAEATAASDVDLAVSGLALTSGARAFHVTAEDAAGNVSDPSEPLPIVVDLAPPSAPSLSLDATTDSAPTGDGRTTFDRVTLQGFTDANIDVTLVETGQATRSDGSGAFSFTDVVVALGDNTFNVSAIDVAGNVSTATLVIRGIGPEIDPPIVSIALVTDTGRSDVDGVTRDPTLTGTVTDVSAISLVRAILDGGPPMDVTASLTGSQLLLDGASLDALAGGALADGLHVVEVQAIDEFLNEGDLFDVTFTLDRIAPTPPLVALDPDSDTGVSNSDDLTSMATPVVLLEAESDSIVHLFADGTAAGDAALPGSRGEVPIGPLNDGAHDITATAEDVAGNASGTSADLDLVVDTVAPAPPTFDLDAASDTIPVGDQATSLESVILVGATDPLAVVDLTRGDDLMPFATRDAEADGTFSFAVSLAEGDNLLQAAAMDAAGNRSVFDRIITSSAPDTTAPVIDARLDHDTGPGADDGITSSAAIAGTVVDASPITLLRVGVDGAPLFDVLDRLADGMFLLDASTLAAAHGGPLVDGPHTVLLQARDEAGNVSAVISVDLVLDTARPDAPPAPDLDDADDSGASDTDNVTSNTDVTIIVRSPAHAVRLFVDGSDGGIRIPSSEIATFESGSLADGLHTFVAVAEDAAGNASLFSTTLVIRVDTAAPTDPTLELVRDLAASDGDAGVTTASTVDLAGLIDPNVTLALDGTERTTSSDTDGAFTLNDVEIALGGNTLSVTATDAAGNRSSASIFVERRDVLPPVLVRNLANDTGRSDLDTVTSDPTITGAILDDSDIASFLVGIDGDPSFDVTAAIDPATRTFRIEPADLDAAAGGTLDDGFHIVRLQAVDAAGHASVVYEVELILDRTAPLGVAVPDLPAELDTGVDDDNVTARNDLSILVSAEFDSDVVLLLDDATMAERRVDVDRDQIFVLPPLADGLHTLRYGVGDLAGNRLDSPTLQIEIDTAPPIAPDAGLDAASNTGDPTDLVTSLAQVTLVGTTDPGVDVEVVDTGDSAVSDPTGRFEVTSIALALGINTLTVRATDTAGNASISTVQLVREPLVPPAVSIALVNDTAQGGGTDDDRITRDPTITITATSDQGISALRVGLDLMAAPDLVEVASELTGGTVTFDQTRLEQILGAPLQDGPHQVLVEATDGEGTATALQRFSFFLDSTPPTQLTTTVRENVADATFTYEYVLENPATNLDDGNEDRFFDFSVEVPASAVIGDVVTPANWSAVYTAGDVALRWTVDALTDAMLPGEALTFGFTADLGPGPANFYVMMRNEAPGIEALAMAIGPTDGPVGTAPPITPPSATDPPAIPEPVEAADPAADPATPDAPDAPTPDAPMEPEPVQPIETPLAPPSLPPAEPFVQPFSATGAGVPDENALYRFELVASGFDNLGQGPSINNDGTVAFTGRLADSENLYTASGGDIHRLMHPILQLPTSAESQFGIPGVREPGTQFFHDNVQINDANQVVAHRRMDALMWFGAFPQGFPIGIFDVAPFSYMELWDGNVEDSIPAFPGKPIAQGDNNLTAATIRLGQPALHDAYLPALAPPGAIGFAILALRVTFSLLPSMSFINPVWGQYWPSPFFLHGDFKIVYPNPTLNNVGDVAFTALTSNLHDSRQVLVTATHETGYTDMRRGGFFHDQTVTVATGTPLLGIGTPDDRTEPLMADSGDSVVTYNDSIFVVPWALDFPQEIGGEGAGFAQVGHRPGISDDGRVIAFAAEHFTDGPGIYVAINHEGDWRQATRLAGISGDGLLDLNEQFDDLGIDVGAFLDFDVSNPLHRVGVDRFGSDQDRQYGVTFLATDTESRAGLHTVVFSIDDDGIVNFGTHRPVLRLGDNVPGVGAVNEIALYDPVNSSGQIVFWARGDDDASGAKIVKATPNGGDVALINFGTPEETELEHVELEYEIDLPADDGVAELDQPLEVAFYPSEDGMEFDEDDRLGELFISPETIGAGTGLVRFVDDAPSETALQIGNHRLLIDPDETGFLREALEERTFNFIIAVLDPDDEIDEVRDIPANNQDTFKGFYQALTSAGESGDGLQDDASAQDLSRIGVVRVGPGTEDMVSVDADDSVTVEPVLDDMLPPGTEQRTFDSPTAMLIVTADEDDKVETTLPSAVTTALIVMAGDGEDKVYAGAGNDYLHAGDDREAEEKDFNLLVGYDGEDELIGSLEQFDVLLGDGFTEEPSVLEVFATKWTELTISLALGLTPSGSDADTINGREGTDFIYGGGGDDDLKGGDGFDVIFGGEGMDKIDGEDGALSLLVGEDLGFLADQDAQINDFLKEELTETATDLFPLLEDALALYAFITETLGMFGSEDAPPEDGDMIMGSATLDFMIGSEGSDTITNMKDWAVVFGNEGIDTIDGSTARSMVAVGGADDDVITGSNSPDLLIGEDGADTIMGNGGLIDVLLGDGFEVTGLPDTLPDWAGIFYKIIDAEAVNIEAGLTPTGMGEDTIMGGPGIDIVIGGDGNDEIDVGTGAGSLVFGDSFEVNPVEVFSLDIKSFLSGEGDGNGADTDEGRKNKAGTLWKILIGQIFEIFSFDGEGADTITGGGGFDVIFGGDGDDPIDTGGGPVDIVFAQGGDDTVDGTQTFVNFQLGGEGSDELKAAESGLTTASMLIGDTFSLAVPAPGPFFDSNLDDISNLSLEFGVGFDLVDPAGDGTDTLIAPAGFNFLMGGDGDDDIDAGGVLNVVLGDSITLSGKIGLSIEGDLSPLNLLRAIDIDTGSFDLSQLFTITPELTVPGLAGSGVDDIVINRAFGGIQLNLIAGGGDGDVIMGGEDGLNFILGNDGDDEIEGRGAFNFIMGGTGTDMIVGGGIGNFITGDTYGLPVLNAEQLSDFVITAGPGGLIPFGEGADVITGGGSLANIILGGDGGDTIDAGGGRFNVLVGDAISLGAGASLDLKQLVWGDEEGNRDEAFRFFVPLTLDGAGDDVITGSDENSGFELILGGDGGDTVYSGDGPLDIVFGGEGTDMLFAGMEEGGANVGPSGVNVMFGGAGDDELFGGDEGDVLFGDSLSLQLNQSFFEDLAGGIVTLPASLGTSDGGADILTAGAGHDILVGGGGGDVISTGGGSNLVFGDGFFLDSAPIPFSLSFLPTLAAAPDHARNLAGIWTRQDSGPDQVFGGSGTDFVLGGADNDEIFGMGGVDALFGNDDEDLLDGGALTDYLEGGQHTDCLIGGAAQDYLFGDDLLLAAADRDEAGDGFVFDLPDLASGSPEVAANLGLTDFDRDPDYIGCNALTVPQGGADEGDTLTLTGEFAADFPQQIDEVEIDWGDGTETTLTTVTGSTFSADHLYADDPDGATPQYTVEVTDPDTGLPIATTPIVIRNVDPQITSQQASDPSIREQDTVTVSGTFTDPGTEDTFTMVIDWADGTVTTGQLGAGSTTFSTTHTYVDDDPTGTPSDLMGISVTISDDDGGSDSGLDVVTVSNEAPAIAALAVDDIDEGGTAMLTWIHGDIGTNDTHSATVDWGDGTVTPAIVQADADGNVSVSHQYTDDPASGADEYSILLTVIDDDGGIATSSTVIGVANADPALTGLSATDPNEGGATLLSGSISDAGVDDTFTLIVDWGDGSSDTFTYPAGTTSFSESHQYDDDNPTGTDGDPYDITVTLSDDDGGTDVGDVTITVFNLPPIIFGVADAFTVDEGTELTLTGTISDFTASDTVSVIVRWNATTEEIVPFSGSSGLFSLSHTFADNPAGTTSGIFEVELIALDDDGGQTQQVIDVTVLNVAPQITDLAATTVTEGGLTTLTGKIVDAGTGDGFTIDVDWGDGATTTHALGVGETDISLTHPYEDDDPTGTPSDFAQIVVTVTDDDGESDLDVTLATIQNSDPRITSVDVTLAAGGRFATLTGSFEDDGAADTHSILVIWGDGSMSRARSTRVR